MAASKKKKKKKKKTASNSGETKEINTRATAMDANKQQQQQKEPYAVPQRAARAIKAAAARQRAAKAPIFSFLIGRRLRVSKCQLARPATGMAVGGSMCE